MSVKQTQTILYTWERNDEVRVNLGNKSKPGSIITTVPLENGHPAPVRLFLPPGLNPNDTTTKYPLVYYVYSGPNTNTVYDTFTVGKFENIVFPYVILLRDLSIMNQLLLSFSLFQIQT